MFCLDQKKGNMLLPGLSKENKLEPTWCFFFKFVYTFVYCLDQKKGNMLLPGLSKENKLEPTCFFLVHYTASVNKRVEKVFIFSHLNLLNVTVG